MRTLLATAVLALAATVTAGAQQVAQRPTLTLDGAKAVAAAAVAEARRLNAPGGAIAVVDEGGSTIYVERLDGTFPMAASISIGKARTAALFRRATKGFEDAITSGRTVLLNVAEAPLQGGVPITSNGVIIGAVGVSGAASAAQDTEIAEAAARAIR